MCRLLGLHIVAGQRTASHIPKNLLLLELKLPDFVSVQSHRSPRQQLALRTVCGADDEPPRMGTLKPGVCTKKCPECWQLRYRCL